MILFFYNVALLAALIVGAPWWLFRMATTHKYREGLGERLGRVPARLAETAAGRPILWLHAVSVGEVLAASRLVAELDMAFPSHCLLISTTTRTGQDLAAKRFGAERVFYCPLDLPWAVRSYLKALEPRLFLLAETEFWPNLLSGCFRRDIPVAVVNARISDRSWPRYRRLRWLWKPFLSLLSRVLAQSETDAHRLLAIGCDPDRLTVTGNLKFDVRANQGSEATRILQALRHGLRLVVAGSTLEGEEAALLEAWPQLLDADPNLALLLAPRHPERFSAVADLLNNSGLVWSKRSDWQAQQAGSIKLLKPGQVVLLDTIGELAAAYSLASVAFVGGSLFPAGGHNPLEPAQFGVPIVMGPWYPNFRAITEDLKAHDALQITPPEDLAITLRHFLADRTAAQAMGARGRQVFEQQAGATARCIEAIQQLLEPPARQDEPAPINEVQQETPQTRPAPTQSVNPALIPFPEARPELPRAESVAPIEAESREDQLPDEAATDEPLNQKESYVAVSASGSVPETGHDSSDAEAAPQPERVLAPEEPPSQAPIQDAKDVHRVPRRTLLLPLIPAYKLALWLRERRLGTRAEPIRRLRSPVVSIGNLSTGGAGKTPLTIALAKALVQRGVQVNVLSRGYGRSSSFAARVQADGTAEQFGDEPLLIAREAGVPVYVAAKRHDAGLLAEGDAAALAFLAEQLKPVVHLLDDGFQHRQLHREVEILLLNRADWSGTLLPAGNLREPLTAIRRASVLALPADDPELEAEVRDRGWQGPIWHVRRTMEIPDFSGPIAAFCGIARPQQFFAGLAAAGLEVAVRKAFPDHHAYTTADLDRLAADAQAGGAVALLTTEKDEARLGSLVSGLPGSLPLRPVRLRIEIEREDEAVDWLLAQVGPAPNNSRL